MTHQNTIKSRWTTTIGLLLMLSAASIGGCQTTGPESLASEATRSGDGTISVAIYPYVPNTDAFETAITNAWAEIDGAPPIEFVSYDCYSGDPPDDLDVFVFDGIYMTHLASTGQLRPFQPSEISSPTDILNYALEGATYEGFVYGIPQIGCTNILYYRSGDSGVADSTGLTTLYAALGDATYTTAQPPMGEGFMMDFSGGTTSACTYVATYEAYTNGFSQDPPLPAYTDLDPSVMDNLHIMVSMAGTAQASYSETSSYQRAQWFNEGYGRAMVGFSEAMSQMGTILDDVELKEMPLADASGGSLYYIDIVGVNSNVVGSDEETWAVKLADLMASEDVIVAAFDNGGNPQYLYPVRESVFTTLSASYPKYGRLWEIVQDLNPVAFRLGADVRTWLSDNKSEIRAQILSISTAQLPSPHAPEMAAALGHKPD